MENKEEKIEFEVKINRILFQQDTFKIVSFTVVNKNSPMYLTNITVKGSMPDLELGMKYKIIVKEIIDKKYGKQYQLISLRSDFDLSDGNESKKFFSFFLTGFQIDNLFKTFDNPLEILENKDIEALCKVKGISNYKAKKIIAAYFNNKDNSMAYVKLYDYGLTKDAIDKLVLAYGSPEILVDKINTNPYILIDEIRGYGWKKADAIALNSGIAPTSKFRLTAFAKYYLDKCANDNGDTWIDLQELRDAYTEVIPEATDEQVREALQILTSSFGDVKPTVMFFPETNRVCLSRYYYLEENICKELNRILKAPNLYYDKDAVEPLRKEVEDIQGWTFEEEQVKAAQMALDNQVSIITGPAGCVDCDTEFFNGKEWKKISEWTQEDKVLQYNNDGTTALVTPERYIKHPADKLWHFSTKYGLDQCLSDNHNVYYITSKGNLYSKTFKEIREAHERTKKGFDGKFITAFKQYDTKGIELDDNQIALMCAVICDGSFTHKNYCRFHIKKDRKKIKLREIFKVNNLEYREKKSSAQGYTDFYIRAPLVTKEFDSYWYNCNQHQLQVICDNVLFWDGTTLRDRRSFATNIKTTADFIQYAFSACGYRATISVRNRVGQKYKTAGKIYTRKSIEYKVIISNRTLITMANRHNKTPITEYKTLDGFEYCFTVPSHKWVMRRNGKIVISGNCGKSSSLSLATKILSYATNYNVKQTALAGRAASRMSEITGLEGYTIHRLIGMSPENDNKPKFNETNPLLADVVILDETSMVDGMIFLKLLKAIPTGCKLIMLGDIYQLESIGLCNLLKDMISSGKIPCCRLEKIHRQAAKSGIITTALKAKNGEQIIPSITYEGHDIKGELQDLEIISITGNEATQDKILTEYRKLRNKGINKEDIDIIVPMRKRGNICLNVLNKKIQDIVANKAFESAIIRKDKETGTEVVVYENDRVIVTENCYNDVTNYENKDEEIAIFNGNIGKVVEIKVDSMVVDLYQVGKVVIPNYLYGCLDLGYAITCHAKQGSEVPYAIIGLDSSCYTLLSREWLYTALTRAKKHCILVGQNTALHRAVKISSISKKRTWLSEFLKQQIG